MLLMSLAMLVAAVVLLPAHAGASAPAPDSDEPVVYYDLTYLFDLDLNDPAQLRRFWDETHLVVSLQGLANRDAPRLYLRYVRDPDDFWWEQMTQAGAWLEGRQVERLEGLQALLERFRPSYRGAVVWDERVPATSNLASTIAGCEDLLCLRHDETEGSLYRQLTGGGLEVQARLLRDDGGPLFTGRGAIPDTDLPSSGSAKCDAYLWLIEHYLKTGKANPHRMGYYLDGFWLRCHQAGSPQNHTLTNHDYVIAQRGVFFDLNVWDDEATVDDPDQPPGTDAATLKALLRAAWDRFEGDGVIHAAGFVPWAYKYTNWGNRTWSAGGGHDPVPTEWRYAEILSCFNAYMDADAIGLCAMANASFFQHYPLAERYPQNPKPTRESLTAAGILDQEGHIVPRRYIAHYVGDYDSAAWLYQTLPRMWNDPARGSTPLSWAFNPNLCERFPLGMAWARERRTTSDWFVAGDSGAGYLNPGFLTPPRTHSGLPSGLQAWEEHCERFYRQWDITLTGFVIDGYAPGLSPEGMDAYARFSPDGIVAQKVSPQGVHNGMPYLRMRLDIGGDPAAAARTLVSLSSGVPPRFMVCRSILHAPSWYAQLEQELAQLAGDDVKVVDLYTLLWLVREFETHPERYGRGNYGQAAEVTARPGQGQGLWAVWHDDGPFQVVDREGISCWRAPAHQPPYYLYFDVDSSFYSAGDGPLEIVIEYLDEGNGRVELQYDSLNPAAPGDGAYTGHPQVVERTGSGRWLTAVFPVDNARFAGSQNAGADFRFFNAGDDLLVRAVQVARHRDED